MQDVVIVKPGLFTTIQDKGRAGFQQFGMPVCGAMDDFSFRAANLLVGNEQYEGVLETTLSGPELLFNSEAAIAITGANMVPRLNGYAVPMWRSLRVSKGDVISLGMALEGARGYIAFAGGMDIPAVMGSCSTYVRGGVGGLEGRKLKAGDEISLKSRNIDMYKLANRTISVSYIPQYKDSVEVRVIMGPQDDCFTEESLEIFLGSQYEVSPEADRMGYRLQGPVLKHKAGADIISDGIDLGSIQVSGHGMPIVMMADRQTTGGYTKIATVISVDMPLLSQLKAGDRLRFKQVSIYEAHRLLREYENKIQGIKGHINCGRLKIAAAKRYHIKLGDSAFEVLVEELDL